MKLKVKIKTHLIENFETSIGVPPGHCMSPVLFTLFSTGTNGGPQLCHFIIVVIIMWPTEKPSQKK